MTTSVPNFNFLAALVSEIWWGPKIKIGGCWSPQTPPSGKYLNPAIVPANAYQCTKFQLPSSISFWDLDGSRNKVGAADLPRRPLADKFLHVAIEPAMPASMPNFNFLALFVSEIKRVSQNLMWGYYTPAVTRTLKTFTCNQSTWQGQTARQISASYLYASCSYANMYFP